MTVVIKDINDNEPKFPEEQGLIRFTVPEEEDPGYFVGRVQARDPDKDKNGRVYYYIVSGNDGRWFSVDKTYGNIYTKQKLDREERDSYMFTILLGRKGLPRGFRGQQAIQVKVTCAFKV